jgi:hypothetical protein
MRALMWGRWSGSVKRGGIHSGRPLALIALAIKARVWPLVASRWLLPKARGTPWLVVMRGQMSASPAPDLSASVVAMTTTDADKSAAAQSAAAQVHSPPSG